MLSDVFFPRINGVSTSIQTFKNGLASHGIDLRLIAPDYGQPGSCSADNPSPANADWVTRLPSRPVPFDPEDHFVRPKKFVAAGQFMLPGLIHVQTPFSAHYAGIELAKWHRIPVVLTYHTLFEEYLHHYLPLLPAALTRRLARHISRQQCNAVDAVVVPSRAMRDRLIEYGVTTPMHIIPTGIPVEQFKQGNGQRFRIRHHIAPDRPMALFVGRMAFEKNLEFLLTAARHARDHCPDLLWIFAGEGPAVDKMTSEIARLGMTDNVRLVGNLDRSTELPDCYAAADVFVFASKTETQGLVLLEAMAAGTPVVALARMGTCDIVEPELGAVSAPDDPAGFARCVCDVISNPTRQAQLASDGQAFVQRWSVEASATTLAALYRSPRFLPHRMKN